MLSVLVVACAVDSHARAPRYVPDTELADFPIIVVARWNKADFQAHHRFSDDDGGRRVITRVEVYTTLEVLQTIKGDVRPGFKRLMVGSGIGWSRDGTYVTSASSTELLGDVADVTVSNIWFLKKARSWDEKDRAEYLSVDNYRAIQPLVLDRYFAALRSRNPEREVPKLLKSDEPEVIRRVLRYVSGGQWPWPYVSEFDTRYLSPAKRGKILRGEADAVEDVIGREALKGLRPIAVAVYAELKGEKCIPCVARLLADKDSDVRGIAVAVAARNRNARSIAEMIQAVRGVTNGWTACTVIETVRCWGDIRLAPALIAFLQTGDSAGYDGDDLFIPAIKARKALQEMTGHVFPYDVAASLAAWDKVGSIANAEERKRLLSSLIPCDPMPLQVEVVGKAQKAHLRVRNASKQDVTVARRPSHGNQICPGGGYGCGFGADNKITGKDDFLTLRPGDNVQFEVELHDRFLLSAPSARKMTVNYDNNGSAFGINAWIGSIPVSFGTDWTEERKVETVEATWPNGNLKSTGQTVNGERYGEWNFFNDEGDRTETICYGNNRGSAKCNPEAPSNKGAGRRQKKE